LGQFSKISGNRKKKEINSLLLEKRIWFRTCEENHKVDHNDHILLETSVVESTISLYDYFVVLRVQKAVAACLIWSTLYSCMVYIWYVKLPNFAI
jgi:hypothetical protein